MAMLEVLVAFTFLLRGGIVNGSVCVMVACILTPALGYTQMMLQLAVGSM